MQLNNKTVLITGASGGIGQAISLAFAKQGARLLLTGRTGSELARCRDNLPSAVVVDTIAADLSQPQERKMVTDLARDAGVDILVNACGVNQLSRFHEHDDEALASMVSLNLLAPVQLTRSLLPTLRARGSGLVINIGSTFGAIGHSGYVGYCATKFGLRGFSEALRRELASDDIRVLYFAPRATMTKMNGPVAQQLNKRLGNATDAPQWVAERLVQAILRDKTSVHLGWPERFYVFLNKLAPGLVDQGMRRQSAMVDRCLSNEDLANSGEVA